MRSAAEFEVVRQLASCGEPAAAISRRLGIPRSTVRGWLDSTPRTRRPPRVADLSALPPAAYSYLLGLYLGDGHVVLTSGSYRLTITLDAAYPGIVKAAAAAVATVMPGHAIAVRRHPTQRSVAVSTHSILWPQLFPQHGPGRKHTRPIRLNFCAHLDFLGVRWTQPNDKDIAVARIADVAMLDTFIGPKG